MKKFLAVLLTTVIAISAFAGCDNNGEQGGNVGDPTEGAEATETAEPEPTAEPTAEPTEEPVIDTDKTVTIEATELFENSKSQCRNTLIDYSYKDDSGKAIALDYTAASIEFNAYCKGDVKADIYCNGDLQWNGKIYYNIYVDGVLQGEKRSKCKVSGERVKTLTLAEGLEEGNHTFVIERQNEAERGTFAVCSVTMNGALTEKPANNDLFIEFIGDSVTTGYGNLYPDQATGESISDPASNTAQDGTRAYAYLTAKALNADYSIVAQEGIGVSKGYWEYNMLESWTSTCYQLGRKTEWNFDRQADVVVINLGSNDMSFINYGNAKESEVQKDIVSFLKLVREKYPNAKIIWAYGMYNTGLENAIQTALDKVGGEDKDFYYIGLKQDNSAGNGHPSLASHETNAKTLANYIKKLVK